MGRILFLALGLYTYGEASFDGRRPAAIDRPVREFRRSVDAIPTDGRRLLIVVDRLRGQYELDRVLQALKRSSL
jgi:hypothetical protein